VASGSRQCGGVGDGCAVVEGEDELLGAVADVVDAELEVEVRGAGSAGVAGGGDELTWGDGVAFGDMQQQVVAVGVA
jgi:hypothetical protein